MEILNTGGSYLWNIEDAENIVENGSDITFTYSEDGDYTWSLTYTDPSGECIAVYDTTINVNVDLITADFTVDNALICDSEGSISLESNSIIDEDDNSTFTYSWLCWRKFVRRPIFFYHTYYFFTRDLL